MGFWVLVRPGMPVTPPPSQLGAVALVDPPLDGHHSCPPTVMSVISAFTIVCIVVLTSARYRWSWRWCWCSSFTHSSHTGGAYTSLAHQKHTHWPESQSSPAEARQSPFELTWYETLPGSLRGRWWPTPQLHPLVPPGRVLPGAEALLLPVARCILAWRCGAQGQQSQERRFCHTYTFLVKSRCKWHTIKFTF